jgi:diguanylate cyclase (GGDEF)-like protein
MKQSTKRISENSNPTLLDHLRPISIVRDTLERSKRAALKRAVVMSLAFASVIAALVLIERTLMFNRIESLSTKAAIAERSARGLLAASEKMANEVNKASVSGDKSWVAIYEGSLSDFQTASIEAMSVSNQQEVLHIAQEFHKQKRLLIDIEREAIEAINRNDLVIAQTILGSDRYIKVRRAIIEATNKLAGSIAEEARRNMARLKVLSASMLLIVIASVAVASYVAWRKLSERLDINQRNLVEAQRSACSDELTGLANRIALQDAMSVALAEAGRADSSVALLIINLDNFKILNERNGYDVGNEVLKVVASRTAACMRHGTTTARYSGDEVAVLLPMAPDANIVNTIAERILKSIVSPIQVKNLSITVGASIGIAAYPRDALNEADLMSQASLALSFAKQTGRGKIVTCRADMVDAESQRRRNVAEVRDAIAAGQIVPYVQPVVSLADGSVVSLEILSRWNHPARGVLAPSEFIPTAEQSGDIASLTLSVLRQACMQCSNIPTSIRLAINAAASQIEDEHLAQALVDVMRSTNFEFRRLEVELTENALVRDIEAARKTIARLQEEGISVALDDFGTGYSSLSYLSQLSFDRIKIDRSFVNSMSSRPESTKIVSAIVGLAKIVGAKITAEGVETHIEAAVLKTLGCDSGQGFLYAKPMPVALFPAWHRIYMENLLMQGLPKTESHVEST